METAINLEHSGWLVLEGNLEIYDFSGIAVDAVVLVAEYLVQNFEGLEIHHL